jgi:hypothetical protein
VENKSIKSRIIGCINKAWPSTVKTLIWLFSWMVPVSLAVTLLDYFGVISWLSGYIDPFFAYLGLSGQSSFVYLTSISLNIYSAIAVMGTLSLNMREITILALMCLIAHNLIIETVVQKKTGSSPIIMLAVRIGGSIVAALLLNWLLPLDLALKTYHTASFIPGNTLIQLLQDWGIKTVVLLLKVSTFVFSIMLLQRILEEFGVISWLSRIFAPFMRVLGLPVNTSFLWIIANVLGLMYGAAIMFEELKQNKLKASEINLLNYHLAINHSLLEDTLLFVAIGVPAVWITFPRLLIAIPVVWAVRLLSRNNRTKID